MIKRKPKQPRLHIFGSSHVNAVLEAFEHYVPPPSAPQIRISPRIRPRRPTDSLTTMLRLGFAEKMLFRKIARLGAGDHLVSMASGNFYHTISLLPHKVPFDFILPGVAADIMPGAQLIPSRTIEAFFEIRLRHAYSQLWQARARMQGRVYQLMAPPPKEDPAFILKHSKALRKSPELRTRGIASPAFRLKCWHLQQQVLQRLCAEHDIEFVPVPPGAQCANGFLKPDYSAADATHANAAYGTLVLRQLEALCLVPNPGPAA